MSCRDLPQHVSQPGHDAKGCTFEPLLTNTNDSSKLGLLVLICSVDGNGAQEDESQNGEEDERHRAEEVSTLPPRRVTSRTRYHDEEREGEVYVEVQDGKL